MLFDAVYHLPRESQILILVHEDRTKNENNLDTDFLESWSKQPVDKIVYENGQIILELDGI